MSDSISYPRQVLPTLIKLNKETYRDNIYIEKPHSEPA